MTQTAATRKWYGDRDRDIYQKKTDGVTGPEIAAEYGISITRVYQICRKMARRHQREMSRRSADAPSQG